jgi:hypothetical protein
MQKNRLFLLIFLFVAGILLQNCGKTKFDPTFYRLKELKIQSIINVNGADSHAFYSTNPNAVDTLAQTDTLGISVIFLAEYYAANFSDRLKDISFFPTANAKIICLPGQKGAMESVTKVNITSDENFDSNHLAGQSLNDLFFLSNSTDGKFTVPLNSFLTQLFAEPTNVAFENSLSQMLRNILLKARANAGTKHVFTISVEYSDGRKFQTKSPSIFFL